ncbi:transposase [Nocardia sp. 2]|uniref:Transposase n=1 Tax=Nocardia acididurans TaxID=2802282 RepID=A0ABS1M3U3_9NOCA|nr:transposase [Nocardia acididurans]MBL1075328.1 transposase [Nocardia acididurans]
MAAPKKYSDDLRAQAVQLYQKSDPKPTMRHLAEQLGVHHEALRQWVRRAENNMSTLNDPTRKLAAENRRLRRRVEYLEQLVDVLRSARGRSPHTFGKTWS